MTKCIILTTSLDLEVGSRKLGNLLAIFRRLICSLAKLYIDVNAFGIV